VFEMAELFSWNESLVGKKCCELQHNAKRRCKDLHSLFSRPDSIKEGAETQRKRRFLSVAQLAFVSPLSAKNNTYKELGYAFCLT